MKKGVNAFLCSLSIKTRLPVKCSRFFLFVRLFFLWSPLREKYAPARRLLRPKEGGESSFRKKNPE